VNRFFLCLNNVHSKPLRAIAALDFDTPKTPTFPAMVAQSLASLLQRASIDDHEEVLQSCNAVLTKSKSDLQAQHMKVVALLKLDRYDEALRTFEAGGDALKKSAGLEYAYASYKCGKLEQATEAVTRTASGRGADHLEAQVV
jgi:signal recognition particle subunit SRP72